MAALLLVIGAYSAPPAQAADACASYGNSAVIVSVGETVTVQVGTGANAGKVLANGLPCSNRTVTNTDTIYWVTASGTLDETLILDMSNGAFGPGLGSETGEPEIDFDVNLGAGNDTVEIVGTTEDDHIVMGRTTLSGNPEYVNLNAAESPDDAEFTDLHGVENLVIDGGPGNDVISGQGGEGTGAQIRRALTISGGAGSDTIRGGSVADVVSGGDGRDFIDGRSGNDTLNGDEGRDVLEGHAGSDALNGGTDQDLINYNSSTGMYVNLSTGAVSGGHAAGDTFSSIEDITGSPSADWLVGDDGPNLLSSNSGSDYVYGLGGNDSLLGRSGSDDLDGGEGNDSISPGAGTTTSDAIDGGPGRDTADYGLAANGVTVDLSVVGNGNVDVAGNQNTVGNGSDDIVNFESIRGTFVNDILRGDGGDNFIFGWGGVDLIEGRAGNDALSAGDGDDTINGEDGNDQMEGGNGIDACDGGAGQNEMWNCP